MGRCNRRQYHNWLVRRSNDSLDDNRIAVPFSQPIKEHTLSTRLEKDWLNKLKRTLQLPFNIWIDQNHYYGGYDALLNIFMQLFALTFVELFITLEIRMKSFQQRDMREKIRTKSARNLRTSMFQSFWHSWYFSALVYLYFSANGRASHNLWAISPILVKDCFAFFQSLNWAAW